MPPRRSNAQQQPQLAQDDPPSAPLLPPNLAYLRTHWKWAAVSQFLSIFYPVIQDERYTIQAVEDDLTDGTSLILPKIIARILYTTTLDRRINTETWQMYLRKQFLKRDPETNPLGDEDEPIGWSLLTIEQKLDAFHTICEWPFANPTRVRTMMNDEDLDAAWRAEPIGYDGKRNSYWFIAGERLWIQRARPLPPKPKKVSKKKETARAPPKAVEKPPKAPARKARGSRSLASTPVTEPSPGPQTRTRNKRAAPSDAVSSLRKRTRLSNTRTSSRLRGLDDEGWEEIPKDLLIDPDARSASTSKKGSKTNSEDEDEDTSTSNKPAVDLDDGSELTELSETEGDEKADESVPQPDPPADEEQPAEEETQPPPPVDDPNYIQAMAMPTLPPDPEGFVEWETICVTAQEWETVAEQFAKSTNSHERSLYRTLTNHLIPEVAAILKERERVVRQQEAFIGRKRSSRLEALESERERIKQEAFAKAEADAKMDRTRRLEARERVQAEERLQREREREERRRERELKAVTEQEEADKANAEQNAEVAKDESAQPTVTNGQAPRQRRAKPDQSKDEKWELDCEVCKRKGWNIDDGKEITCCEKCGKWQHTECHDAADDHAKRPRRNWSKVDFTCKACQRKTNRTRQPPQQPFVQNGNDYAQNAGVPTAKPPRPRTTPRAPQGPQGGKPIALPPMTSQHHYPHLTTQKSMPLAKGHAPPHHHVPVTAGHPANGVGSYPMKVPPAYPAPIQHAYAAAYYAQQTQPYHYYTLPTAQSSMNGHPTNTTYTQPPNTLPSLAAMPYSTAASSSKPSGSHVPGSSQPTAYPPSQPVPLPGYYTSQYSTTHMQYYGNQAYVYGTQYRPPAPIPQTSQPNPGAPPHSSTPIPYAKPHQANGSEATRVVSQASSTSGSYQNTGAVAPTYPPTHAYSSTNPYQQTTPASTYVPNGSHHSTPGLLNSSAPPHTLPPIQSSIPSPHILPPIAGGIGSHGAQ